MKTATDPVAYASNTNFIMVRNAGLRDALVSAGIGDAIAIQADVSKVKALAPGRPPPPCDVLGFLET